ncbi:TIGR02678 family protein [Saccharopolyspora antimicrobica]|uniref:TIGR02678 family protein n=1 Tax=Saccharopolyspora antimicrobica TaxID=455193 RepID=A0A1I5EZ34_9PSEU|nr:uncharacterized protein (TIGR02678 family) [Saccharopolyspora antimicrobica]SFO16656.1 TIGR02678 family protein [Saccharopolyspora antimicrobica]
MSRHAVERQRAFTTLLRFPVLERRSHPEVWSLVRVHQVVLGEWFSHRLGYRLVVTDSAARLFRLPVDGTVLAPRRFQPPSRRVIVLAILGAAAAEDAEDITTTQDLSDRVRALSAHEDVALSPYDPDRFAERKLFVKAVQLLVSVGALRPTGRDDDEQREGWAHRRDAVGGAYEVRRELLLRMADPLALRVALAGGRDDRPPDEFATRHSLMRRLIELPVLLHGDLTEAERSYLTSQRHRVLAWCAEMTGWTVEQRAEGMALIAVNETDTDLPFPRTRAADFVALMVLDELLRARGVGAVVTSEDLRAAAAEVKVRYPKALINELRADGAVESTAQELLSALDLLRPIETGDAWWLTAVAARYRDPQVVVLNARLDEEAE